MKEFDIDKLKRENVFKTPEGFFEDVQNKVIQDIAPVSRGRIINLNWAYGVAAGVALLVGVNLFINSDPKKEAQSITNVVSVQDERVTNTLTNIKPQNEEAVALQILENDLTSVAQVNQKANTDRSSFSEKQSTDFANQKEPRITQNPEIQVDQILSSFTSAELADVGKNTEQDIYLDLYN